MRRNIYRGAPFDESVFDESAFDESVFDESTPTLYKVPPTGPCRRYSCAVAHQHLCSTWVGNEFIWYVTSCINPMSFYIILDLKNIKKNSNFTGKFATEHYVQTLILKKYC